MENVNFLNKVKGGFQCLHLIRIVTYMMLIWPNEDSARGVRSQENKVMSNVNVECLIIGVLIRKDEIYKP